MIREPELHGLLHAASAQPPDVAWDYNAVTRLARRRRRRRVGTAVSSTLAVALIATVAFGAGTPGTSTSIDSEPTSPDHRTPGLVVPGTTAPTAPAAPVPAVGVVGIARAAGVVADVGSGPGPVRADVPPPDVTAGPIATTCPPATTVPATTLPQGLTVEVTLPTTAYRPGSPITAVAVVRNTGTVAAHVGVPEAGAIVDRATGTAPSLPGRPDRTVYIPADGAWSFPVRIETTSCDGNALPAGDYLAVVAMDWSTGGEPATWYSPGDDVRLNPAAPEPSADAVEQSGPCTGDDPIGCRPGPGESFCLSDVPAHAEYGGSAFTFNATYGNTRKKPGENVTGMVNIFPNDPDVTLPVTLDDVETLGILVDRATGEAAGAMHGEFRGVTHYLTDDEHYINIPFSVPTRTCRDDHTLGDPMQPGTYGLMVAVHVRGFGWWTRMTNGVITVLPS